MQWETAVLLWLQENVRCALLDALLVTWSKLGNAGFIWILLSLALLIFKKTRKAGALSLLAMLFSLIFTNGILKQVIARQRPELVVAGLRPLLPAPDVHSFPSGHTAAAAACAAVWMKTLPVRWGKALAVAGAVLMGFSRLYVGVHFPTDVLAAAVLGVLYACAALWGASLWEGKRKRTLK